MAYTIKSLAKVRECENIGELIDVWDYWLACNSNDEQSVNDFFSLRKADRKQVLDYMLSDKAYLTLYDHTHKAIVERVI